MAELIKETIQSTPVYRLLRCQKTRRYFKDEGWTEDPSEANTFSDEIDAVRTCIERGLSDVELVLRPAGGSSEIFSTPIR